MEGGYLVINFNGESYLAHRIAYFMETGEQPPMIDHINHNKADNRACNLRAANAEIMWFANVWWSECGKVCEDGGVRGGGGDIGS